MRFAFSHRAPLLAALSVFFLLVTPMCSRAAVHFSREFAPQDGLVAPAEKPYRDSVCLNGTWQFQPLSLPADFHQGHGPAPALPDPTADGWDQTPIRIPSPWNANAFAFHDGLAGDFRCFPSYPESWNSVQMGWLRRAFSVPAAWKGRRLILHFDAVAGDTQVVVNGKTVGHHFDIFLPFDIDVTDAVKPGANNELLVGVRKASLFDIQGKYGRRTYQGGSMWGQHIAGIWQDVTLEALPAVHISDVFVKPMVDQDRLEADVTVRNDADHPVKVSLAGTVSPWISEAGADVLSAPEPRWRLGRTPALTTPPVSVTIPARGSQTVTLGQKVGGRLKFWSPGSPNLYGLVCRVKSGSGGGVTDAKYTRFGWRQITFQGAQVLLNGKRIIMKGDSWHFIGIPEMSRRYAWAWYKALKDAHLNAVRLHAEPYPPFFMDVADEQGILVLDESAMWASDGGPKLDDPAYWDNTVDHLRGLVLRDRNHPSVFGWSVSNEIQPVIGGVFHGPQSMTDTLIRYDAIWAGICRKNDPTRVWISTDGEEDAHGTMPTDVVHYGGTDTMKRASVTGKPWGVGEAGPAYYGSPQQIAQMSGDQRAYLSAFDRMEGVAVVSYQNLIDQRKYDASYRSVFNLVWYGLKPLNFGLSDTSRPPTLQDGVFFGKFVEGKPGVQPERIGPYAGTLNPGYDPSLPLYQTWPLFDAIKDAQAEPPVEYQPTHSFTIDAGTARDPATGDIPSVLVLAGAGGSLAQGLTTEGVSVLPAGSAPAGHRLVMVDGAQPPGDDAKPVIDATLAAGGTVMVWGANPATLDRLNALLPARLELTSRTASSLVVPQSSPLTAGLTPESLYFSELNPSTILPAGLGGPLVTDGTVLLAACNTDWKRWNGQAETDKTAMLLRSEREAKPSGAALVELDRGPGKLLVCVLPVVTETPKAEALNRTLLANLGLKLGAGSGPGSALSADGTVTHALAWGWAGAASVADGLADRSIDPNSDSPISDGIRAGRYAWRLVGADAHGSLDLSSLRAQGDQAAKLAYLSFWLDSPKALDNLLLDPHLPSVGLQIGPAAAAQVWLNGKAIQTTAQGGGIAAPTLLLQKGVNHVLVKVIRTEGEGGAKPALKLNSSQADYLTQLRGTVEKP